MRVLQATLAAALVFAAILGAAAVFHPDTPLPDAWNPVRPFNVADPVTPLTGWKLRRTANDPVMCLAALAAVSDAAVAAPPSMQDLHCQIENPVTISRVGDARLSPVLTDCAVALRLAIWEAHGLQPAAAQMNTDVTWIDQVGSFNCRAMRTQDGDSGRWSTHATAEAIDVSGFRLGDGRKLSLARDWNSPEPVAKFLRAARDSACDAFATTLGPDYNALHADHFHLQSRGWGTCR
jgi:hypothetical protein